MKKWMTILLSAALLLAAVLPVTASTPNLSYSETYWSTEAPAPDAYQATERYNGPMMGTDALMSPEDMVADEAGNLYIADTDNSRILKLDTTMQLVQDIREVTIEGETSSLTEPRGVFVRDGYLYIADTGNQRVLKTAEDGTVVAQYLLPQTSEYTLDFFTPTRVAVDSDGMVFVLVEGVHQGFLLYTPDGVFQEFFGSARVQATFKVLLDRLWKQMLSRDQRKTMANYVPTEYVNMTVDSKGFLYACCLHTDTNVEQIRKLNYLGNNIYPYTGNFGEMNSTYYQRQSIITTFTDVAVSENHVLFGADSSRGRIYAFDQEGNRLFTFGASGEMEGAFKQISSLVVYGDTVYVLDQQLGAVTAFTPTEYGRLILQAMENYSEGRFAQAQETWKTLLERNANLELAYSGMGEALLKSGEYREAMTYFRQGNNPERESVAFSKYRAQLIRDNPVAVSVVLLVLLAGVLFLSRRAFWVKRRQRAKLAAEKQRGYVGDMLYVCGQTLIHPVTTLTERKYKRYRSWPLVGVILLWWFLVGVLSHELTGFRFSGGNEDLNIFLELLFSVIPFVLFCVSNWACCSILDGEGRFDEICTFTALGMLPNLLIQTLAIPLSNVLCLAEQDFYNWFLLFGVLWSAYLLFQAIRITQQYSTGKTILMILLSLAGIVIILFLLLLVVALVQQIYSFVMTLVSELSYKG